MEDSDKAKMNVETLLDQFTTVQTETNLSHVLQWGTTTFTSEPIGDFEAGNVDGNKPDLWKILKESGKKILKEAVQWDSTEV